MISINMDNLAINMAINKNIININMVMNMDISLYLIHILSIVIGI